MTVLLTLTTAGVDSGPFDLYSNLDSYTIPFEIGISKASLQAGYSSSVVPDYAAIVRVKSSGICINYTDIILTEITTSTTSSSSTIAPSIAITIASTQNQSSGTACGGTIAPVTAYVLSLPVIQNQTIIYTDAARTSVFQGNYIWFRNYSTQKSYQIDDNGIAVNIVPC